MAARYPACRFAWLDIEDQADLVGDVEVETFPTLLIGDGRQARFLGPLLPQAAVLVRLLASLQDGPVPQAAVSAQAQAVFERVLIAHAH